MRKCKAQNTQRLSLSEDVIALNQCFSLSDSLASLLPNSAGAWLLPASIKVRLERITEAKAGIALTLAPKMLFSQVYPSNISTQ